MARYLPDRVRDLVYARAQDCCEYCISWKRGIGQEMHVDHIIRHAGAEDDNLALACPRCNMSKASVSAAVDPLTGETVSLFHPRKDDWREHFAWSSDFLHIQGLTATGRATVQRLRMNSIDAIDARRVWIKGGVHPPPFMGW